MTAVTTTASPQSLARGAAGTALLAIEQALTGGETWTAAHHAIGAAFAGEADAGPGACLLHGVPALALVLHAPPKATGTAATRQKPTYSASTSPR